MIKKYILPPEFQEKINQALNSLNLSWNSSSEIAEQILRLSNHYQQDRQLTPWDKKEDLLAQLCYFLPLNFIRNCKVVEEAIKIGFPQNAPYLLEYGVGLGPSLAAITSHNYSSQSAYSAIDRSPQVLSFFQKHFADKDVTSWNPSLASQTCAFFSYSLNELEQLPPWFFQLRDIVILEPSTQLKGRRLMELKKELREKEYHIWAPCTHQEACPLLYQSEKDWCHDRVHWEQPQWFQKIEKNLPIKNQTLTFSYLLASKSSPPSHMEEKGRFVGDPLHEKGKTRWLYCRGPEREFLSWLHRFGNPPEWQRGDSITTPPYEKKGNELRIKNEDMP